MNAARSTRSHHIHLSEGILLSRKLAHALVCWVYGCVVNVSLCLTHFYCFEHNNFRIYIELWKRKQSTAAMEWGSSGCEDEEQDRAVYKGERIKSPVNGQMITYFPPEDKENRATRALVCFKL